MIWPNWPGSAFTAPSLRVSHDFQVEVLADEPPQHRFQVQDHPVEVDHLGVDDLLAAKGQQLLGQGRGPVAGLQDIFQVAIERIVFKDLGPHEFAVARDGHQEIVEIVGHAPGQPAHRFHLLGLEELLLPGPCVR